MLAQILDIKSGSDVELQRATDIAEPKTSNVNRKCQADAIMLLKYQYSSAMPLRIPMASSQAPTFDLRYLFMMPCQHCIVMAVTRKDRLASEVPK